MEAARNRSLKDDRGNSVFEYALVSAVFAMAVLGAMTSYRAKLRSNWPRPRDG